MIQLDGHKGEEILADIEETKRLMGALVRMKPKPHDEMKTGKKAKKKRAVVKKAARRKST